MLDITIVITLLGYSCWSLPAWVGEHAEGPLSTAVQVVHCTTQGTIYTVVPSGVV